MWRWRAPASKSAGKRHSSRIRPGNQALKNALVEAAHAAAHAAKTYLQALYKRLAGRRGKKRALIAAARSILVSIYHMLKRGTSWQDLGAQYFEQRDPARTAARLAQRLQHLGCQVTLTPMTV